jgi:UDP-GlcNAc:undecaprenyl-phosphate GlcNAc-1-phosphate transferase
MLEMFLAFVAVATALLVCLNAETLGRRLRVMDHPDSDRKCHIKATPLVGGIGILLPLLIWLVGVLVGGVVSDKQTLSVLMVGAAGVGLVGFADDQTPITALSRILLVLVYLAVTFVISPGLIATGLNWGSFEPTILPGWVYCGLLGVTTIGIVNAVNMADGQNGVVPSMFVIWSLCLMLVGDSVVSHVARILAVASFVVLTFNVQGRLFLGDCGSYGVTFVLGLLSLMAYAQGRLTIETVTVWFFIPVMDCLRLIITRGLEGRSPVAPDKNHFHHRLQSKLGATYGLVAYSASVGATSFIAALAPQFALVCIIVLTAIYFSFAFLTDSASARATDTGPVQDEEISDLDESFTNVVSIAGSELSKRAGGP